MKHRIFLLATISLFVISQQSHAQSPPLKGPYLGQKPPGMKAELFAPGIVSTDSIEHSAPVFSPDGKLVLWTVYHYRGYGFTMEMRQENGVWTKPQKASFTDPYADDFYPSLSVDGKTLFISSRRRVTEGYPNGQGIRIWTVARTPNGWGQPAMLDTAVSKGEDYASSVAASGNIYFSFLRDNGAIFDIAMAPRVGNGYGPVVSLGNGINTPKYEDGPFIAPDESYLIFESDRPGGIEGTIDLYISFRQKDGSWGTPKNMGPKVNSKYHERFARVSPDGKYLFFGSTRSGRFDIYWISAKVIDELKDKK